MRVEELGPVPDDFPQGGRSSRRSTIRKAVLLVLLLLLLSFIVWATSYYLQNRRLPIPRLTSDAGDVVAPPEYLYSISGPQGENALTRPIGVAVGDGDRVYIADTTADTIRVYTRQGEYLFSFSEVGEGALEEPAYVVVDAQDNVYVSDRRAVYSFTPDGEFIQRITPQGEGAFGPLGMCFDKDGNLYVTDVGETLEHRIVVFDEQGREIRRFGSTAEAGQMSDLPGRFHFPNGIIISEDERLLISDSNNRRVQVFSMDGGFDYFIRTSGIPRGMTIDESERLYVVDALAHTVDVYTLDGERIVSFGTEGVGPGQFRYANDVALDSAGRIYVSDRENNQVQVWAWPEAGIVVPGAPETTAEWAALLIPLLLLPLLLWLLRRKRFVVTEDFVNHMVEIDELETMRKRRYRFITTEAEWPAFEGRVERGVELGKLIKSEPHSDTDARDLVERLGVAYDEAALLVAAKRAKRLCTEDIHLASFAGALEIEVLDAKRYIDRYGARGTSQKNLER